MILSQIVAVAKNKVMGINNTLPWDIPEDMKFFREKTKGHVMIMGRKTFDSLGEPLPRRFHIVISSQTNLNYNHPHVEVVPNLEQAIQAAAKRLPEWPQEVFIIGGSGVFEESFPVTNKIYLTLIDKEFSGDVYYPDIPEQFELTEKKQVEGLIPFAFTTWERKQ